MQLTSSKPGIKRKGQESGSVGGGGKKQATLSFASKMSKKPAPPSDVEEKAAAVRSADNAFSID